MADKTRIKVAVVEGDYADLCSLGLPLALSYKILNCLGLWSATTDGRKAKTKKPRRKRKRGKAKQQAIPNVSNIHSNVTTPLAPALATSVSTVTSINALSRSNLLPTRACSSSFKVYI